MFIAPVGFDEFYRRAVEEFSVDYISKGQVGKYLRLRRTSSERDPFWTTVRSRWKQTLLYLQRQSGGKDAKAATMLTASMDTNDFFTEARKLRPVESPTAGVFLSGVCPGTEDVRKPLHRPEQLLSKISGLLAKEPGDHQPERSESNPLFCNGCASCEKVCPYGAISYEDRQVNDHGIHETRHVAVVNGALCHGCSACTVACPSTWT